MLVRGPSQKIEVACPFEAVGHVIGHLSAIGGLITGQDVRSTNVVISAEVPCDEIAALSEWLSEFRPVQGSTIVEPAANDEDV